MYLTEINVLIELMSPNISWKQKKIGSRGPSGVAQTFGACEREHFQGKDENL